jgi:hypothetical protein
VARFAKGWKSAKATESNTLSSIASETSWVVLGRRWKADRHIGVAELERAELRQSCPLDDVELDRWVAHPHPLHDASQQPGRERALVGADHASTSDALSRFARALHREIDLAEHVTRRHERDVACWCERDTLRAALE